VDDVRDPSVSRVAASRLSLERRAADLDRLRRERFDVLIVGGGVTGAGAAVDAASRGLSVALVEARDLASGTSSRSTKLVHGGLRYLEQLDIALVHEALQERGLLATRLAPHLVRPMPFLLPLPREAWYGHLLRGYYGAGVAMYDVFAGLFGGDRGMPMHRHLSARAARRVFPSLRSDTSRRRDPVLRRPGRRRPVGHHAGPDRRQPGRGRGHLGPGDRHPPRRP
jgi:glycerol-3-phosphate dehydrogenase